MAALEENPVFICGLPRTGTSLVLALLDGHPQLVVASHESKYFLAFWPAARRQSSEQRLELAKKTLFSVFTDRGPYWQKYLSHLDPDEVLQRFESRLPPRPRLHHYLNASVLAYGDLSGQVSTRARHWVEKTPFTERHRKTLSRWWPRARFIHMVRDPRDLLFTYRRRDRRRKRPVTSPASAATSWRESAALALEGRRKLGESRYLVLRYENLVTEPARQLARIAAHLRIETDEILTLPTRAGGRSPWGGNAIGRTFSGIETSQVGRWREGLPKATAVAMEAYCHRLMGELGYETEELRGDSAGLWFSEVLAAARGAVSRWRRQARLAAAGTPLEGRA